MHISIGKDDLQNLSSKSGGKSNRNKKSNSTRSLKLKTPSSARSQKGRRSIFQFNFMDENDKRNSSKEKKINESESSDDDSKESFVEDFTNAGRGRKPLPAGRLKHICSPLLRIMLWSPCTIASISNFRSSNEKLFQLMKSKLIVNFI
jgi:hypothetical protein